MNENIHDRARRIVAQSPRPMTMSDAYAQLSRRRKNYGRTTVRPDPALAAVESPPRKLRLPYADN